MPYCRNSKECLDRHSQRVFDYLHCNRYKNCGGIKCPDRCHLEDAPKCKCHFTLAWAIDGPNGTDPSGWEIEIVGTPSEIDITCNDLVQWINCPPCMDNKQRTCDCFRNNLEAFEVTNFKWKNSNEPCYRACQIRSCIQNCDGSNSCPCSVNLGSVTEKCLPALFLKPQHQEAQSSTSNCSLNFCKCNRNENDTKTVSIQCLCSCLKSDRTNILNVNEGGGLIPCEKCKNICFRDSVSVFEGSNRGASTECTQTTNSSVSNNSQVEELSDIPTTDTLQSKNTNTTDTTTQTDDMDLETALLTISAPKFSSVYTNN